MRENHYAILVSNLKISYVSKLQDMHNASFIIIYLVALDFLQRYNIFLYHYSFCNKIKANIYFEKICTTLILQHTGSIIL